MVANGKISVKTVRILLYDYENVADWWLSRRYMFSLCGITALLVGSRRVHKQLFICYRV